MNKEDYKAIAEIIEIRKRVLLKIKPNGITLLIAQLNRISRQLADYFEREDKKGKECQRENNLGVVETYYINLDFNRKQFLKWCGVE